MRSRIFVVFLSLTAPAFAADVLDIVPPSARVRGLPGSMSIQPRECRTLPAAEARARIVGVALQQWDFFGSRISDYSEVEDDADDPPSGQRLPAGLSAGAVRQSGPLGQHWLVGSRSDPTMAKAEAAAEAGRRRSRLPPAEAARVAPSIAGYWAVTPEGSWIVARQNDRWNGEDGIAARWNAPWSAAFISWVMCEGGLGTNAQFQRAVAHHSYIDQAIRARDGRAPQGAFVAYDPGETTIGLGDLLCSSRRPAYRTIADRRRQMGAGARSHCDVVVKVDEASQRVHAIGGNVRGVVSLKLFPAVRPAGKPLRVGTGDEDRPMFAHLKLR